MMSTPDALLLVAFCAITLGFVLVCTTGGFPGDLAQRVARKMKVALRGSQAATIAILNARREREKATASRRELETSSFEAYTHCGGCGKLDFHPMREPTPTPAEYEEAAHKLLRHMRDIGWGGDVAQSIVDQRRPAAPETAFGVIRTCSSCSHEWGQR